MNMIGKIACFVLLCMVVVAPHAKAAITCSEVQAALVRCLPYLTNRGPIGGCCGPFKAIWGAAKTVQERRTACSCTKSAATIIKGIDYGKAAALPGVCNVNIPFKLSLSVDCNKIQ